MNSLLDKINDKNNSLLDKIKDKNNKFTKQSKINQKNGKFINMWISEKYCKHWSLKEALREFIQNQYDGIITKVKSKDNFHVEPFGNDKIRIKEKDIFLNYKFFDKNNNIIGEIIYDKEKKTLTFSNDGELNLGHLLLGSLKEEENNPNIIGKFGEGMKLAILHL